MKLQKFSVLFLTLITFNTLTLTQDHEPKKPQPQAVSRLQKITRAAIILGGVYLAGVFWCKYGPVDYSKIIVENSVLGNSCVYRDNSYKYQVKDFRTLVCLDSNIMKENNANFSLLVKNPWTWNVTKKESIAAESVADYTVVGLMRKFGTNRFELFYS